MIISGAFKRLREANLKIKPEKAEFIREEVAYYGPVITPELIRPNFSTIECILKFPQHRNQKDTKSFLSLEYYRWFIPNFAKCLNNFDSKCISFFEELKKLFTASPFLIYANFDETFLLTSPSINFYTKKMTIYQLSHSQIISKPFIPKHSITSLKNLLLLACSKLMCPPAKPLKDNTCIIFYYHCLT